MPSFTLNITGNAKHTQLAEQANLRLAVSTEGDNKQQVAQDVLRTAKQVEDMIKDGKITNYSQTAMSMYSFMKMLAGTHRFSNNNADFTINASNSGLFGNNTGSGMFKSSNSKDKSSDGVQVRHHRGSIEFLIKVVDFAVLGQLTSNFTMMDFVEIRSLDWELLQATQDKYKNKLRLEAAQDARIKAKEYCGVMCLEDVTIVPKELVNESDNGWFVVGGEAAYRSTGLFRTASSGDGPEPAITLTPKDIKTELSVSFVFTVETNGFKASSV